LSSSAQAKLLRFLEDGEYYRVGGTQKYAIKTRIVSATNRNLEEMIEQKHFRQDLYFRIAVVKVEVPSLNDRPEDIIPIAQHFLSEFSDKHNKTFTNISEEVKQFFKEYQWKGNVRELRNLIERGVLIGAGPSLKLEDLGVKPNRSGSLSKENISGAEFPELPAEGIMLEDLESHYVREAYAKADGNEKKAAQLLGLTYYAYRYKRKK
jgi:transcriptional regulator with PAS, ATPase and Fis domain